jgi:hypothetical protein
MPTLSGSTTSSSNGDRRKKPVVTYGRPARAPAIRSLYDEPSTAAATSKLKRPAVSTMKKTELVSDEFDIPMSDDESTSIPIKSTMSLKTPIKSARLSTPSTKPTTRLKTPTRPTNPLKTPTKSGPHTIVSKAAPDSISPRKRKRAQSQAVQLEPQTAKAHKPSGGAITCTDKPMAESIPRRSTRQLSAATPRSAVSPLLHTTRSTVQPPNTATSVCPLSPVPASPTSPAGSIPSVSTTPKQKRLWHELLLSDSVDADSHATSVQPSRYSQAHTIHTAGAPTIPSRADQSGGREQPRIVDQLKTRDASAHSSDAGSDDETDKPKVHVATHEVALSVSPTQNISQDTSQQSHPNNRPSQSLQPSISQGSAKVTYARSRTYMQESLEDMIFGDLPMLAPERPTASARRTDTSLAAKRKHKVTLDHASDDDNSQSMPSIHDLRAAGHQSRFRDDIIRLMDDMKNPKPSTRSQRRMALMELADTLADHAYASRFVEHGFDANIIDQFQYAGMDVLADMVLCVVLTRMPQASASLLRGGALDFLSRYLDENKDIGQIARDRKSNMSKVAQSDYLEFMEKIRTSDSWDDCSPEHLTPCLVALVSVDSLAVTHRRHKNSGAILSSALASKLVSLAATTRVSESKNDAQAATNRALSALEAATTLDVTSASSGVWSKELLSQFASALPTLLDMPKSSQALALRFCCSVTNDNEDNTDVFSEGATVQLMVSRILDGFNSRNTEAETDAACDYDLLVLAIGLMINLTSLSEVARERSACAENHGLAALVEIFVKGQKKAAESQTEEEMQANISYGWLSVLLGYMCLNQSVRERVCALLPGKKLALLVGAVEGIALMNQQVDSQVADEREETSGFTEKLMTLVARLQESA